MDFQPPYFQPPYLTSGMGVGSPMMGHHLDFHRTASALQHSGLGGVGTDAYAAHLNNFNNFQQALTQGGLSTAAHSSNSYTPYNFPCAAANDRSLFGRYCYEPGTGPLSTVYDMKNYNNLSRKP